jgi:SAM-dependent MidA family methyltransferase
MPEAPMMENRLPVPGEEERAHSEQLSELIREAITGAGGRLSFARYMDLALNAPGLGYYRAPLRRFGEAGDFVTAPEISPLFGRCLARQVAQILDYLGGGEVFEVGAGSGRLCAQLLGALAEADALPRRYLILEPGAELRARQRDTLEREVPELAARVAWMEQLPAEGFEGVVLANELLDALPVRRFQKHQGGIREAFVACLGEHFVWKLDDPEDAALAAAVEGVEAELGARLPDGYVSETGCQRNAWVATAGAGLARGALLLFDYGYPLREYFHPQRSDGTLVCFYRHRAHYDPFVYPGLQDISVHVEFSGLSLAALERGLALAGFTTQAEFLMASGLLEQCGDIDPQTRDYVLLTQQIKRLTLPGQMGELVKVLALTRGVDCPLLGFSGRDLRNRLS